MTDSPLASSDELNSLLQEYFDQFSDLTLIKRGNDNENYSFISGNKKYILRIYNEVTLKKRSEEDILEEIEFINFFYNHQVPTAQVFPNKQANLVSKIGGRFCAVFEFCPGDLAYGRLKATYFHQVGELMGKVHKLTVENNLQTGRLWRGIDIWDYLIELADKNPGFLDEEDQAIYSQIKNSFNLFKNEPTFFTHGDYHFANILFDGDQLSALLDFDSFTKGHLASDISRFFVADLAYTTPVDYHHTQEFIDEFFKGYQKFREISSQENEFIKLYINLHFLIQVIRLKTSNPQKLTEFKNQVKRLYEFYGKSPR